MVATEPSGHTAGKLDLPNPKETKENNCKCSFIRMMETFKKKMKNSLKEMVEKTNKKLESINHSKKPPPKKKTSKPNQACYATSSRLAD